MTGLDSVLKTRATPSNAGWAKASEIDSILPKCERCQPSVPKKDLVRMLKPKNGFDQTMELQTQIGVGPMFVLADLKLRLNKEQAQSVYDSWVIILGE